LQTTIFYHSIRLILYSQQTGEIDNLTVSWDKVLGCVVCRFHVAAGAKLCPGQGAIHTFSKAVAKLVSINLQKLVLSPTGSINLGLIWREDLLVTSQDFIKFWGKFFAFVLLVFMENPQGFKTF
jgi:hypothetical protein